MEDRNEDSIAKRRTRRNSKNSKLIAVPNENEAEPDESEVYEVVKKPKSKRQKKAKEKEPPVESVEETEPTTPKKQKKRTKPKSGSKGKKSKAEEEEQLEASEEILSHEAEQELVKMSKKRPKVDLATLSEGVLDLSRVTMKDLIRYGGSFGKPTKAQAEREAKQKALKNKKGTEEPDPTQTLTGLPAAGVGLSSTGEEEQEEEVIIYRNTEDDEAEKQKRKQPEKSSQPSPAPKSRPSGNRFAPQVRIDERGDIVVDEESLLVTQETEASHESYETVFESTNVINSLSFSKYKPTERWTKEETEKFYKALQQFGSEFSLIAKLFPTRTRRQIRNKFKKEEKDNLKKVDWALSHRIPIDVEEIKIAVSTKPEEDEDRVFIERNEELLRAANNSENPPSVVDENNETSEQAGESLMEAVREAESQEGAEHTTEMPVGTQAEEEEAALLAPHLNIQPSVSTPTPARTASNPAVVEDEEYQDPFAM